MCSDFFRLVGHHAEVFTALPPGVHRGVVEAYIAGASRRGLTPEELAALAAPWLTEEGQAAFYRQIAQADQRFTDEVQHRYPDLGLPVHIVWGADDAWITVDRARELHRLIPGATLEVLPGAGHLVHLDAPAALAVALHRWLLSVRSPHPDG